MTKKIHITTTIRYPVGGIRTYLKYTYGRLDRKKYSFTLIGPTRDWMERIRADLDEHEVDVVCSAKEDNNLSFYSAIAGSFFRKRPDVIHSQGYTAGMYSTFAKIPYSLPHVITLHRIFGHDQFSGAFWGKNARIKKYLIEFLLKQADVVQSVSNDAQENLLEYFPGLRKKPDKLKVILNGINIHKFDNPTYSEIETFTKDPGLFYLGYLGRYMPEKGFPHLIEAVDVLVNEMNVRNIRIISVGGFGQFIREYRKEINRRGIEGFFQFLGFFDSVAPVLKKIDVLVIPSLSEACPLVPMEGLVCGTPIIAYSCPGLREVLKHTPARMVETTDRIGLANQVIKIMGNYKIIRREFDEFIPEARVRFDSIHTAQQIEELFERLIHPRAQRNTWNKDME